MNIAFVNLTADVELNPVDLLKSHDKYMLVVAEVSEWGTQVSNMSSTAPVHYRHTKPSELFGFKDMETDIEQAKLANYTNSFLNFSDIPKFEDEKFYMIIIQPATVVGDGADARVYPGPFTKPLEDTINFYIARDGSPNHKSDPAKFGPKATDIEFESSKNKIWPGEIDLRIYRVCYFTKGKCLFIWGADI